MHVIVTTSLFVLIMLNVTGFYTVLADCPSPNNKNCNPIGKSCITETQIGTGLSWFNMEDKCAANKGRLAFLRDDFNDVRLRNTLRTLNSKSYFSTKLLAIGMVMSLKGDDTTFWITPGNNETFSCATDDTDVCLSSLATTEHCNSIGCCWVNGKCQYPEHQWLTETNGSVAVDTSAVVKTTERNCVGLEKNGSVWALKAYNCSMPALTGTGYVCEYKCENDWPTMSQQNVSWTRNTSPGTHNTGKGRNKAAATFQKKLMLMVYFGLLPLIYKLTICSA